MAFLLNSQAQGVSGKTEQSTQTPWRETPEERGPMQLHRLHWLKAGPAVTHAHKILCLINYYTTVTW